jgi:glycosyltransferase involved in cell wall biosynthesis
MLFWAAVALGSALSILIYSWICSRKLLRLENVVPCGKAGSDETPTVSVIIPACNEGEHIGTTLSTLLAQDYPSLELVVINDRSTDRTGEVIEQFAVLHPQVKTLHVETLPGGWLGKNHALQLGASQASGEYFLFTDGDIRFEKTTIARGVCWMKAQQLDHLTLLFRNTTPGGLLNAVIVEAMTGLLLVLQPWKVSDPRSKYFIGIGAFNLVRRDAYLAVGGHARNPMHPIDDIILGKIIKQAGFRQGCLRGERFVSVNWYADLGEMVEGLMKNVFAFYNYNIFFSLAGAAVIIGFSILPFWGMFVLNGPAQILCVAAVCCRWCAFVMNARGMLVSLGCSLFAFLAPYILLYISLKATVVTLKDKGIWWRGTHYPLQVLRSIEPIITLRWLLRW